MIVTLIDLNDALARLAAGELPYEFMTDDPQLRLLGPACKFGASLLQSYRKEGLYAESIEEASEMARAKNAIVTGIWFVKREQN
ncbi:MAG: hypothetical protein HYR56_24845 [Acidobacteria bacterium]|nr:hypothetical protein [Acidobacteriota bacterium]MBI3428141.1 hypothetical protein [Acidobacteriota bacterium]